MLGPRLVGKSDIGLIRPNNEDAFLVSEEWSIAALADGMGGAAAGELASGFFISAVQKVFSQKSAEGPRTLLRKAFDLANRMILDHASKNPDHSGLGCTAELLLFFTGSFALGHVGDSRAYLFRNMELKPLTQDHSYVQELVNKGSITAEAARRHPMRHIITRAIGQRENLEVDMINGEALPGDVFLLCSDGLSDMIDDRMIEHILSKPTKLDRKVLELIDAAIEAGGKDNVTAVLCEVD